MLSEFFGFSVEFLVIVLFLIIVFVDRDIEFIYKLLLGESVLLDMLVEDGEVLYLLVFLN